MRPLRATLAMVLAGSCAAWADEQGAGAPAVRMQITELIRQSLAKGAQAEPAPQASPAPRGDPVVMPAFTVTDDYRALDQAVDDWQRKIDAGGFTWRDGGTYKKVVGLRFTTEFEFRFNPENHGIELLKISW